MKRIIFTLTLFVVMSVSAHAEKTPDWSIQLEGTPVTIFKHSFTGIPIVETSSHYYAVNYVDKKVLWSAEKGKNNILLEGKVTLEEIPFTPFVSINNKFINVSNGNVLMGEDDKTYKTILAHDILPELYCLLIKVKDSDGAKVLYCIDLESKKLLWGKKIAEANGAKDLMKKVANTNGLSAFSLNVFAPQATADRNIVYKNGKTLLLINSKSGDIIWKNECNPGTFFLDDKQDIVVVVESASGVGNAMAVSVAKGPAAFGKKIFALDIKTGKELWKKSVKLDSKFAMHLNIDDDNFIAAHNKGLNIFNYKDGSQKWKKDYETKKIQELTLKDNGIEVFYGNKIMLVDMETGKKAWKKPIKFDDIPEDEEGSMIKREYDKGLFIVGPGFFGLFDKESGKKIWKNKVGDDAKVAFDNKNKKVAVVDKKNLYLFDPNTVDKKAEKIKLDIEEPKEIIGFETVDKGYFIAGLNEFFFLDKTGVAVNHQYFTQLQTDRLLKAALAVGSVASGIMSSEYAQKDEEGNTVASGGVFMSAENAKAMGETSTEMRNALAQLKREAKLRGASVSHKGAAYFLKGERIEGGDKMSLVKIDKNSGEKVDEFAFGDNRKVTFELDKLHNKLYYFDDTKLNVFDLE